MTGLTNILFGSKRKPEEIIRKNQKSLKKVIRDLEREQKQIEKDEQKLITEIKKAAKNGQTDAMRIMAKDLVQGRMFKKRLMMMKVNIEAISFKLTTLKSTHAISKAMKEVAGTLKVMNKQMNITAIQKILMEFEKETETMELKGEMMEETVDDLFETGDEADMDKIVDQVFDELGIEMNMKLKSIGTNDNIETKNQTEFAKASIPTSDSKINEDDLEARLANLKKL